MGQFRIVRAFGNGITPSTEKAYRVESTHLTSELDALSLLDSITNMGKFQVVRVFANGTRLSNDENHRVESVHPVSERDALTLMRELNSPYAGSRYLFNGTSVSDQGTRVSSEGRQQG